MDHHPPPPLPQQQQQQQQSGKKTAELDPVLHSIGFEIDEVSPSQVTGRLPITSKCCQPFQVLHGGVSALVAEGLASMGAHMASGFQRVAGVSLSINHFRSAKLGDVVLVRAAPIHVGRSTQVWDVKLWKQDEGKQGPHQIISESRVTLLCNLPVPDNLKHAGDALKKYAAKTTITAATSRLCFWRFAHPPPRPGPFVIERGSGNCSNLGTRAFSLLRHRFHFLFVFLPPPGLKAISAAILEEDRGDFGSRQSTTVIGAAILEEHRRDFGSKRSTTAIGGFVQRRCSRGNRGGGIRPWRGAARLIPSASVAFMARSRSAAPVYCSYQLVRLVLSGPGASLLPLLFFRDSSSYDA